MDTPGAYIDFHRLSSIFNCLFGAQTKPLKHAIKKGGAHFRAAKTSASYLTNRSLMRSAMISDTPPAIKVKVILL